MRSLSFSMLVYGILAGCSGERPAATDDGAQYAGATDDVCAIEGQTRECWFVINHYAEYKDCIVGTQRCGANLRWGACERPDFVAPSSSSSSSSSGDEGATFAGAPASDDEECPVTAPALDAAPVEIAAVAGTRPSAEGGRIVPGTYVLTRSEIYVGDESGGLRAGPTGQLVARSVVVTNDHVAFTEGEGTSASGIVDTSEHVQWFATAGTVLGYQPTCPRRNQPVSIEYSASGSEIVLFPNAQQRDVLTRKP